MSGYWWSVTTDDQHLLSEEKSLQQTKSVSLCPKTHMYHNQTKLIANLNFSLKYVTIEILKPSQDTAKPQNKNSADSVSLLKHRLQELLKKHQ